MKTIGNLIKEARLQKDFTKEKLGEVTHIRTSFITAIEKGDWKSLPEFGITLGFIKSITHFLDVDERHAVSVFRRDYPPKLIPTTKVNKEKEINRRFTWGPKMTFLTGIIIVLMIILGYLGFQYKKFNSPPDLIVNAPVENQVVRSRDLEVKGKTDPDATVTINNQEVVVGNDGNFIADIIISNNTVQIIIKAESRSGKSTQIERKIKVQI